MPDKIEKPAIDGPDQIIEMVSAFQKSRIILTAFELDIFTVIGSGRVTSTEVADAVKADPRGTDRLLNALCALGFLRKEKGCFMNTGLSLRYLVKGSEDFLSRIGHSLNLYRSWGSLTDAVRAGKTVLAREYDPVSLGHFIEAMHHRAKKSAERLVSHLDLSGIRRVLDVGGGSGVYSMAFARAKPGLQAVVLDLPRVTALTKKYIDEAGLSASITTMDGDYNTDDFGTGYDLVFMSAIVHINSCDENVALMARAYRSLNPGGMIVIQDHIMENDRTAPVRGALFALNMLVNTQSGDTFTEDEMRQWLEKAGCVEIKRIPTGMENDLMTGKRPA
ncbi:MAG TPA: methyltransferase [Spirochaetota bacterium]|nr:methyltransferase [Spirochaetota bacterium]HPV40005.1 methyltransferase [Spirochaetota bacterium]